MSVTIITPVLKDRVLAFLCTNCQTEELSSGDSKEIADALEMSFETLHSIFQYFQRIGFIEDLNMRRNALHFILLTEANDFVLRGGFTVQEEIVEESIKKMILEIDLLKKELAPDLLSKADKIASLGSGILSALSFLKGK